MNLLDSGVFSGRTMNAVHATKKNSIIASKMQTAFSRVYCDDEVSIVVPNSSKLVTYHIAALLSDNSPRLRRIAL